jgi:metallo-beta-lactamase class B
MKVPGLRSGYDTVGGICFFGRLLDKIRLHAAGKLPADYVANLGDNEPRFADGRCTRFLHVSYGQLAQRVLVGGSDEEVLEWCFAEGRRPIAEEIQNWNGFITKLGWRDDTSQRFAAAKQSLGFGHRTDVNTWLDLQDADEERPPRFAAAAPGDSGDSSKPATPLRQQRRQVGPLCALMALGLLFGAWAVAAETNRIEVTPDLQITRLAEGVWLHISWQVLPGGTRYPSNGLLVRDGDALTLVDTAWGEQPTRDLLAWVARELKLPVSRAIVTHAHDDRMGGAPVLAERNIPMFSHPLTGPLAAKQGWPRPTSLATSSAAGSVTNLGAVEVFYPGPAHTVDNLVVWLPRAKLLFGGCAVKDLKSRHLGNVADADVAAWPASLRRLQERYGSRSTLVVPGHGAVGDAALLRHTLELLAL